MTLTTIEANAALIVIDLQRGITGTDHPAVGRVVERAAALSRAFREHGKTVVLVNVDGAPTGRTDARRGQGPREFPAGWDELDPALEQDATDVLITKHTWGAFHGTALNDELRARGVTQVFVVGIATSKGVESTARAAHEHGYHVVLPTDVMFDADSRAHANAVESIFPALGEVTDSAEVLRQLDALG